MERVFLVQRVLVTADLPSWDLFFKSVHQELEWVRPVIVFHAAAIAVKPKASQNVVWHTQIQPRLTWYHPPLEPPDPHHPPGFLDHPP